MVAVAQSLREQVAWACRILASEGYADLTLGHISARGPEGDVWIKRKGVALDEVEPEDVVSVEDADAVLHLETVLHTGVYRARADVGAVVHGHPPYATALGATAAELELLTHDAVLFVDGLPVYDETAELITQTDQGRAVAAALGNRNAVLLRNHGVLAVGRDVPWAVLVACTLEREVRLQAVASTLGELRPIDELQLNGRAVRDDVAPQALLLDYLREQHGLTGAKRSCDVQVCGTCTVLVDGLPVSSCCTLLADVDGRDVLTIEGFAELPEFERFERAFVDHAALQCGFCTGGMLLPTKFLLAERRPTTNEEIRRGLSGNLCRCTGYHGIVEAVAELAGV